MAQAKLICSCAFVLIFIFSSEIISTQGRLLITMNGSSTRNKFSDDATKAGMPALGSRDRMLNEKLLLETSHNKTHATLNDDLAAEDADDFRPTTPGHSPGIGHATGPASIGPYVWIIVYR